MKRLTPKEFWLDKNYIKPGSCSPHLIEENKLAELLQAYADHLEATAWVTDGSFPPVDLEDAEFSQNVLAYYEFSNEVVAYVNLRNKNWYNAKSHDRMTPPIKWCPLPIVPQ